MVKKKNVIIKMGLDSWVMTYGDMMSLLLTFFVLIVSFSSMQESKFEQAAESLREAFGVLTNPESVIEFNRPILPNHAPTDEVADVLYQVRVAEKAIMDLGFDQQVEIQVNERGVLFRIKAPMLFNSGQAELREEAKAVLKPLAAFMRKFPYKVTVEGHTDPIPIHSSRFPTNWELSAGRAAVVARYFQGVGIPPDRLAATGYGEFRPITDNSSEEGRAKNRRVEIFLDLDASELPKNMELPFAGQSEKADQTRNFTENNPSVRPILNPVTDKLGILGTGK